MPLGWADVRELGRALHGRFPRKDPLTIRFPDLERWVRELEGFDDPGPRPGPRRLEEIQAAWYDAFLGRA